MSKHIHVSIGLAQRLILKMAVWTRLYLSLLILLTIIALLIFATQRVQTIFLALLYKNSLNILHDIAFILIIVKAYRLLYSYLQTGYANIRYVIEIAFIAPAIEIVFAADKWPISLTIVYGVFGLLNFLIYLIFYEKLARIEKEVR